MKNQVAAVLENIQEEEDGSFKINDEMNDGFDWSEILEEDIKLWPETFKSNIKSTPIKISSSIVSTNLPFLNDHFSPPEL